MNNEVGIITSIQAIPASYIFGEIKRWEFRRTKPKQIDLNAGVWNYLYVTKALPKIYDHNGRLLNGRIAARFWLNECRELIYNKHLSCYFLDGNQCLGHDTHWFLKQAHITVDQLNKYGKGKKVYAWKVKDLEMLETLFHVERAPQSWCYVSGSIKGDKRKRDIES